MCLWSPAIFSPKPFCCHKLSPQQSLISAVFVFHRNNLPSCSSPSPFCEKVFLESSGSESIDGLDRLLGKWNATHWSSWSAKLRTSTGSAGHTWPRNRSTGMQQNAEPRTGSRSRRPALRISLNTNASQITWVIWESLRTGQVNVWSDMQRLCL